ncbi:hypothetical protein BASA83_002904 [Batrachochytrium salamandrivorans]|nr:hypothetical protein BASA83_002904 [Batrachochytrium salamandrivorans]
MSQPADEQLSQVLARLSFLESENTRLTQQLRDDSYRHPRSLSPLLTRKPRAQLPDKLNGESKNHRTFVNQLNLLFMVNPLMYHSDSIKIATAASLLTGTAATWFN